MPFNVLLLPLLGGFIFVTRWNSTRFKTKRYSGERLIFHAAIAGVFLLFAAFVLTRIAAWALPGLQSAWGRQVPFAYAGTSLLAFFIGLVAWIPLTWWVPYEKAARLVIQQWNDSLEVLLDESMSKTRMIGITLKSGKVYIGFVTSNFDPAYDRKYVRLWPILSGYRDDTQSLRITTNYANVYAKMIGENADFAVVDHFQVIVPLGEVQSANHFDPNTYDLFNPTEGPVLP